MTRTTGKLCRWIAAFLVGMLPTFATAQESYPTKMIRIIVGVAPGGLIDVTARHLAQNLSQRLGQPVIVENKPGANTTIGANTVRTAAPDGYTLFYGGAMSASPIFVKDGAVDFVTQMRPISQLLVAPFFLLVNSNLPVRTIEELAAYSRQNPGKLNLADSSPASTMVMHALAERTGISYTPIPYRGSAPSMNALIAGEIEMTLDTVPNYLPHIKAGKVRAVLNTGRSRAEALPDVPSAVEAKIIDFSTGSLFGLWAPLGTPDAIVQRLNADIAQIAATPDFREKFRTATQVDPSPSTPDELLKAIEADKALYGRVAKQINFQAQ